jgi:hypothetical protein
VSDRDPLVSDDEVQHRLAIADIRFDSVLAAAAVPEERLRDYLAWHRAELIALARIVFAETDPLTRGTTWESCDPDDEFMAALLMLREISLGTFLAARLAAPSPEPEEPPA